MGEIREMETALNLAQTFTEEKKDYFLSPVDHGNEPEGLVNCEKSKPVELKLREQDLNIAPHQQILDSEEQMNTEVLETYMNPVED